MFDLEVNGWSIKFCEPYWIAQKEKVFEMFDTEEDACKYAATH